MNDNDNDNNDDYDNNPDIFSMDNIDEPVIQNDIDYYSDQDLDDNIEPQPNPIDITTEHSTAFSITNPNDLLGDIDNLNDDDIDNDDDFGNNNNNNNNNNSNSSNDNRRSSYTMNQQTQTLIRQYQQALNESQRELREALRENELLLQKQETIKIECDSKMYELQIEIDELQIATQQYQIRYQEKVEELNDLKYKNNQFENADKEKEELILRLQNIEQHEMQLIIDFEQSNKQNITMKNQLKIVNDNNSKLQKAMLTLKKENTKIDKNLNKTLEKLDLMKQQYEYQANTANSRLIQLQTENEIYRQNLSKSEQEKIKMQTDFTQATMELITDNFNDDDDNKQDDNIASFRLRSITAGDLSVNRAGSVDTPEPSTPVMTSSFVKHKFGSTTSLPDVSLLDQFDGHSRGHSRGSSMGSRMGNDLDYIDPIKLKQDIRNILVDDIKSIISEELNNINDKKRASGDDDDDNDNAGVVNTNLLNKIDELIKNNNNNSNMDQNTLNQILIEFKLSIEDTIKNNIQDQLNDNNNTNIQNIQKEMNDNINKMLTNMLSKNNQNDDISDILKQTVEGQMTVLQISLENQISQTVQESVNFVINKQINENLRNNIKNDITDQLNDLQSKIIDNNNNISKQNDDNDKNDNIKLDFDDLNKKMELSLQNSIKNVMNGKIDNFMDDFRKEVIPEIKAIFEELSSMNKNNISVNDDIKDDNINDDDEKQSSISMRTNSLLSTIDELRQEINQLKDDKLNFDKILKDCATSKIHQIVKLQNLIDHQRNDNRILKMQLDAYIKKFNKIKQNSEKTVVNKLWGVAFGNYNPQNVLST